MSSFNDQFFNENGTWKVKIEDVESLKTLLDKKEELESYIADGWLYEAHAHNSELVYELGDLCDIPSVFSHFPVFPLDDSHYAEEEKNKEFYKKLLLPVGGVTAFCLLLFFIFHVDFFNTLSVLGIFATAFIGYKYHFNNKQYAAKKKVYDASVQTYLDTRNAFQSALASYEQEKAKGIETAKKYGEEYKKAYTEYMECIATCAGKKKKAQAELDSVEQQINEYDFAPNEYHQYIPTVLSLLKSGRADDYKEALNMAIDEEQRRIEAEERRAEEARRTALLERQMEEERRHNQQMEREAEMQRKQAQDNLAYQQRQQEKAEQKARSEQMREEASARQKASLRCQKCAKRFACGSNRGIPNCGAFEPDAVYR